MGHNLNAVRGRASMMYVGEVPWHKLGTKLEKPATAAEAIQAAGLDYRVDKTPLRTTYFEAPIEGHFATVRTDTFEALGVVGARYVPVQNRDAFTLFDALVGEGEAIYHTAGVLGKGERIWLLAKLPDYIRVNDDDIVEKFLLLTNSHDGTAAIRVKLTPIRVLCENTLTLALSGAEQEVRIRHTANAGEKLKEAHKLLGLTNQLYAQLKCIFGRMSEKKVEAETLNKYVKAVFPDLEDATPSSRRTLVRDKVFELVESGKGARATRGTLWGAYNAVTEFVDHYRQPSADPSTRLKSIWFGSGEKIKKQAFKVALHMLN